MNPAPYIRLLRPLNCLMAALACFIGYSIASGQISLSLPLLLGMLVVFLVCGAGQAINDYVDRDLDAQLHPEKPLPSKQLQPRHAVQFSLTLFALSLIIAYTLPLLAFVISVVFSFLLIAYAAFIQKFKALGNILVALGTAFTLIFGGAVAGNIFLPGMLALSAFFSNLAREIIKDAEDQEADKGHKATLPQFLPPALLQALVLTLTLIGIAVAYLPFFLGRFGNAYFALISISSLLFLFAFFQFTHTAYAAAQRTSKAAMLIALLGFLAGVIA